jgi:hypothetical protein
MTTSHADHDHDNTKAARALCRKNAFLADSTAKAEVLACISTFRGLAAAYERDQDEWIWYGVRAFTAYKGTDIYEATRALLDYFAPTGDDAKDARALADGHLITTDPYAIRRIILRRAS